MEKLKNKGDYLFHTSFCFLNKIKIIYGTEECTINLSENLGADGSLVSIR